ncbi:MAG: ATPase associated with various cellular 5, partial [Mucilaginibacter sp.]|nr:ATPase associated with various cellular 5 [Mucilaginibacter sp.]
FLRRCLFYHIPVPKTKELIAIVSSRIQPHLQQLYKDDAALLKNSSKAISDNLSKVVEQFELLRDQLKEKQPATAELLEWVKALEKQGFFNEAVDFSRLSPKQKEIFGLSFSVLAKSKDDLEILMKKYL